MQPKKVKDCLQLKIGSVQNVETSIGQEGRHVMYVMHQKLETLRKELVSEVVLMKEEKLSTILMTRTMMNMTILVERRRNFVKVNHLANKRNK